MLHGASATRALHFIPTTKSQKSFASWGAGEKKNQSPDVSVITLPICRPPCNVRCPDRLLLSADVESLNHKRVTVNVPFHSVSWWNVFKQVDVLTQHTEVSAGCLPQTWGVCVSADSVCVLVVVVVITSSALHPPSSPPLSLTSPPPPPSLLHLPPSPGRRQESGENKMTIPKLFGPSKGASPAWLTDWPTDWLTDCTLTPLTLCLHYSLSSLESHPHFFMIL